MVDDLADAVQTGVVEDNRATIDDRVVDATFARKLSARGSFIHTVIGFLVAPLVPGLLIAVPGMIAGHDTSFWLKFSALIGYPVAFVGGIPLHFLLKRNRWVKLRFYCAAGIPLGMVAFTLPYLQAFLVGSRGANGGAQLLFSAIISVLPVFMPLSVVCAVIASSSFWFVARPDRS